MSMAISTDPALLPDTAAPGFALRSRMLPMATWCGAGTEPCRSNRRPGIDNGLLAAAEAAPATAPAGAAPA